MLMMHEGGRQHLVRQRQKLAIVKPRDDAGKFDEIGHFFDQRAVLLEVHAPVESTGVRLQLPRDAIASILVPEHNEVLRQAGLVLFKAAYFDRSSRATAGGEKPMPVGQRAGLDVEDLLSGRVGGASYGERDDAPAVQKQQPSNRPAEQQLAAPIVQLRVPVHLLGKGQVSKQPTEQIGQRVYGALSALTFVVREVLALGRRHARKLFERNALFLRKPERRRGRLALSIEGG